MKTRREFFKLFGKAALVGGVVAAVPATAVALAMKPIIEEENIFYTTSGYVQIGPFEEVEYTDTVTETTGTVWTYVGKNGEFLGDVSEEAWTLHKNFYEGVR